jgi:lysophospholipase L1-like esterase
VTTSIRRQRLFALLALLIPFAVFAIVEGGLRIANYRGDLRLFVHLPNVDPKYLGVNERLGARYFVGVRALPTPPGDLFLAAKPAHGFRVFVLGESSAAGFPYGYNGTFSRVLRDALQDVMPQDTVEVVNLGLAATSTYTLYDEVDEILAQHPDAVMIYAGHNEFYGALGAGSTERLGAWPAFVRTYLRLQRLKTVLLAREVATGLVQRVGAFSGVKRDTLQSLMQQMVREELIPLNSPTYEKGVRQFRSNMGAILRRFQHAKVPVFVGSLTSNLRDQAPFRSLKTGELPAAEQVYAAAREALANHDPAGARKQFERARDLDALRFRAPTEFNSIIRTLVRETGAHYVPVDEAFAASASDGIPGSELFWEHLHPNQHGYHLIGKTFFEALAEANFVGHQAEPEGLGTWDSYADRMALTDFDQRFAWHQIKSVTTSWPFVTREDPTGYPRNYRPESAADSAAFATVILRRASWPAAKFELAQQYRSRGELQRSYDEFRGLIRDQPENATVRVYAGDLFMQVSDLARARILLEQGYAIERSAFTCYALGHLEVESRNGDRAVRLLQEAQQFRPDVPMVLYDLSRAYALQRDAAQARAFADRLATISPDYPGLEEWRAELGTLPN